MTHISATQQLTLQYLSLQEKFLISPLLLTQNLKLESCDFVRQIYSRKKDEKEKEKKKNYVNSKEQIQHRPEECYGIFWQKCHFKIVQ